MEKNFLSLPLSSEDRKVAKEVCPSNGVEYDFQVFCDEWGFVESFQKALDFEKPKDRSEQYFCETVDYCRFKFVDFFKSIVEDFSRTINISSELSSIKFYGSLPYQKETNSDYESQRRSYDEEPTIPRYKGNKSLLTRPTEIKSPEGKQEFSKYLYNIRDSFMWFLQNKGIGVSEGQIRPNGKGGYVQKGVDVLMTAEILMAAKNIKIKDIISPKTTEILSPVDQAIQEIKEKIFVVCTSDNDIASIFKYAKALGEGKVKIAWMPLQKNFDINKSNNLLATMSDYIIKPDDDFIRQFRGDKSKQDSKLIT